MNAASAGWDMACRLLGDCRYGGPLDREVGDMVNLAGAASSTVPKQFSYVRYDPDVSAAGLQALGLGDIRAEDVQVMDSVDHIPAIQKVGQAYAQKLMQRHHLRGFV
jgi:hypothetical protein